jgi:hypothetical protein
VEIAATFVWLLPIKRPSAAVGPVLTEAMRNEGPGSTWVSRYRTSADCTAINQRTLDSLNICFRLIDEAKDQFASLDQLSVLHGQPFYRRAIPFN